MKKADGLRDAFINIFFPVDNVDFPQGLWCSLCRSNTSPKINYDKTISKLNYDTLIALMLGLYKGAAKEAYDERIMIFKRKLRHFITPSIKVYKKAIKSGIIENVVFYYPQVSTFQESDNIYEQILFFTKIIYVNGESYFVVSKMIADDVQDLAYTELPRYIQNTFDTSFYVTIPNNDIYVYTEAYEEDLHTVMCNDSLRDFLNNFFDINFNLEEANVCIATRGELEISDNIKRDKTTKKIVENVSVIANKRDEDYEKHCLRAVEDITFLTVLHILTNTAEKLLSKDSIDNKDKVYFAKIIEFLKANINSINIVYNMMVEHELSILNNDRLNKIIESISSGVSKGVTKATLEHVDN